jgi:hypothetical protein
MAPAGYGGGYATSIPAPATSPRHHHPPPYPLAGQDLHHTRPVTGTRDPVETRDGAQQYRTIQQKKIGSKFEVHIEAAANNPIQVLSIQKLQNMQDTKQIEALLHKLILFTVHTKQI